MIVNFGANGKTIKHYATHCAYTGEKFTPDNPATLEHIELNSDVHNKRVGGVLAVTEKANHDLRGELPFDLFVTRNPQVVPYIQSQVDGFKYERLEIGGENVADATLKTLNEAAKGVVTFTSRLNRIFPRALFFH